MNIRLIRGNLNRKADGNPELGKRFPSVETLYPISSQEDKEKVQTTNMEHGSENYSSKKSVLI